MIVNAEISRDVLPGKRIKSINMIFQKSHLLSSDSAPAAEKPPVRDFFAIISYCKNKGEINILIQIEKDCMERWIQA